MSQGNLDQLIRRNTAFLGNLFRRGPFEGHGFICHPPSKPSYQNPLGDYTLSDRPVSEWVPDLVENYRQQCEFLEKLGDHNVPMVGLMTGTHLYAAAVGCKVHRYPDTNPAALPLVRTSQEADALAEPDVWKSPTLYRVFELAEAVRKELGRDVYFGPPDMQSGFDSASLVWNKEDFFCAMIAEPDAAKRLIGKCASLYKKFLLALRKEVPTCSPAHCPRPWAPPDLAPWLSNDECGAFSTEMFEEFCLPELQDLSSTFGGLGMHCCADADHQFESFKKIPNFYAFNRVPAKRSGGWLELFKHFSGPAAPVHAVGWQSAKDVKATIDMAGPGTRFVFVYSDANLDACRAWLDAVHDIAPVAVA